MDDDSGAGVGDSSQSAAQPDVDVWAAFSTVTLWVLAGGVVIGVVVIGAICVICTILNRRYALRHPKERKFIPVSEKHYQSPSSSGSIRSSRENHRDSLKEIADKCGFCPTPSSVQVIRTEEGGTKNQLVESGCHGGPPQPAKPKRSLEMDNGGIFMGEPRRPPSITKLDEIDETAAEDGTGQLSRSASQKSLPRSEGSSHNPAVHIQVQTTVTQVRYHSHGHKSSTHSHPLLHPNFHSQSKDESPEREDFAPLGEPSTNQECLIEVTSPPILTSPETTQEPDSARGTGSEAFSPQDPCRALWELRSALENKVSPGDPGQLLMSISDRSDDGGEAATLESTLRSLDVPASMLTSLTSFESNTPSDESFDATSCAKALKEHFEAIFDEPSDLPVGAAAGRGAAVTTNAAGTHLVPPVYKRRKQASNQNQKLTSHQKRQSFKKAHHLATGTAAVRNAPLTTPSPLGLSVAIGAVGVCETPTTSGSVENNRPVSPSRLMQMKNDSGYKSQSFDATVVSQGASLAGQICSFKSVPVLSRVREGPLGAESVLPVEEKSAVANELLAPENASFLISTSTEADDPTECPSFASSVDVEPSIPLLKTHPPSPSETIRDWSIDAKSDRLFREFSKPGPGSPRRHRGLRGKLHVRPYSPSSSHSGSKQASIEEEHDACSLEEQTAESQDSSMASNCTVIRVPEKEQEPKNSLVPSKEPPPDFIFCSTREQVFNYISRRSKSPELRHVPIIKLPDQPSDEV